MTDQQSPQANSPETITSNKVSDALDVDADIQNGDKKVKLHFNVPVVVACIVTLIAAIVTGLVVLEQFGVIDDFVKMKTHRSDKR